MLERLEWLWMDFSSESIKKNVDTWVLEDSQIERDNKCFSITWTFQFPREIIKSEMEKSWFIFHEQPKKDTDFLLCWEKAWSKREKAEELWIKIYDSRENIVKSFPFLWNLKIEEKKIELQKPNQPSQMSLF